MSWDLFVQDLPPGISSMAEIPDDFAPRPLQIPKEDLIRSIRIGGQRSMPQTPRG